MGKHFARNFLYPVLICIFLTGFFTKFIDRVVKINADDVGQGKWASLALLKF